MVARSHSPAPVGTLLPTRVLVAAERFDGEVSAQDASAAIAAGVKAAGQPQPDTIALDEDLGLAEQLAAASFDTRLHVARALVVATPELDERTLAGSPAFELATRARQAGVPAYAVTRENRLDAFDARILDLQEIVQADGRRALRAAGRTLARALIAERPGTGR